MAKRGGFPGGGIPGNMNNLPKQAQKEQRQMEENQKALEEKEEEPVEKVEIPKSEDIGTRLGDLFKNLNL